MTRSLLRHAATAALVATALSPALAQHTGSPPVRTHSGAPPPPGAQVQGQDLEFLLSAARLAQAEIQAGRLALDRSQDAGVRKLAQRLVSDWEATHAQLQQIAQARRVALPNETSQQLREEINGLQGVRPERFDHHFLQTIGNASHQQAIRMYQAQAEQGQDPALTSLAVQGLAQLRQHLALALALQEQAAAARNTRAAGAGAQEEQK